MMRGNWSFFAHNLLHPLAGACWFVGLDRLGDWLHDIGVPEGPGPSAAGVIVLRDDGCALGFIRRGDSFPSLPCGKVDRGEDPADAAVREALEETGCVVAIYGEPYTCVEPATGSMVATYRASLVRSGPPPHTREGRAIWCEPQALTYGRFGAYNADAMRALGVE